MLLSHRRVRAIAYGSLIFPSRYFDGEIKNTITDLEIGITFVL